MPQEYAYITGGANGLGKAVAARLVSRGIQVWIADRDEAAATGVAKELGVRSSVVDVASWDSQLQAFTQAVSEFGRIDYVFPIAGIGENRWTPTASESVESKGFDKPNMAVLDVNVNGAFYTLSLAVQQFRRQSLNAHGYKGKVIIAGSVCGVYCCPSLPIYTASKHAITGMVRSWGKFLQKEHITLNSINPNVMRTNISTATFYDTIEAKGLMTPLEGCVDAFVDLLDGNGASGECFEVGPNYAEGQGAYHPLFATVTDWKQKAVFDLLAARGEAKLPSQRG